MLVLANPFKLVTLNVKKAEYDGYSIHLFQNDIDPDGETVLADFTEATFTGYADQGLESWGTPFLNGDFQGVLLHAPVLFEQTGTGVTNNIYGYFVLDGDGGLAWSERNADAPVAMDATGAVYAVVPVMTEDTMPEPPP